MVAWGKLIAAAAASLLLTGCLWGPGKFTSELALRKNGSFVLDYRGEVVLQAPGEAEMKPTPWKDSMARCHRDGGANIVEPFASDTDDDDVRQCTPAELARLKIEHEKSEAVRVATKRKSSEEMSKLFGLPGSDEASNGRFAANLMKYQGWRSVRYVGKGVFDVDYHFEGRLTQDYVFPMMPDTDIIIPFVMLRRRNDGTVMVTAPALTGGSGPFSARAKMMGLPDKGGEGPVSRAQGRFTISTDGEILTNNSEDGPVSHPIGRQVQWDVGLDSTKIPEMLVRL